MEIIIFFLIAIILIVGIPIGISNIIYKWIKKKGYDERLRFLALIPILIVGYFIYDATYPSSDFYKTDFKEVTNMEFPESGKIKFKTASFPDHFGDYTSSFLVELEQNDLKILENQLKNNGFQEKKNNTSTGELDYIERKKGKKEYLKQYLNEEENDKHYSVGFLDDKKSVIITRISW
ncbi:hypothetical protein UMM65_07355 [Aureibaculum sp. 2210JD6-5]|uniref:hypothetical protein n=1 Tax=Aureibaculum sp. 2210JD6-5 TaxID=3103957 RepID=UPI002AADEEAC|nr:hypothetical protein [Aureibaculum sp. 2210JD6-5]MDY7395053.1 hypothetical protein [Aureibaculum sp. 2210JD6-5]